MTQACISASIFFVCFKAVSSSAWPTIILTRCRQVFIKYLNIAGLITVEWYLLHRKDCPVLHIYHPGSKKLFPITLSLRPHFGVWVFTKKTPTTSLMNDFLWHCCPPAVSLRLPRIQESFQKRCTKSLSWSEQGAGKNTSVISVWHILLSVHWVRCVCSPHWQNYALSHNYCGTRCNQRGITGMQVSIGCYSAHLELKLEPTACLEQSSWRCGRWEANLPGEKCWTAHFLPLHFLSCQSSGFAFGFFFPFSSNVLVKVSFLTDLALLTITEVISNSLSGS